MSGRLVDHAHVPQRGALGTASSTIVRSFFARTVLAACGLALGGCSSLPPVQPWQKGLLAQPEMAFDPDPLRTRFEEHIYFSKEGASGGGGVGGGGCGCN